MLIIDIVSTDKIKFKGSFFKKQIRHEAFKRKSMNICGKTCTLIEFNESMLEGLQLDRLLNTFKGQILGVNNAIENIVPVEYRFDYRQYFKRALISSLVNNCKDTAKQLSLCVKNTDFLCSDECFLLANMFKSFTLISHRDTETEKFLNRCFVEFGNFIRITDDYVKSDVYIDLDKVDKDCKTMVVVDGKEQLLYPDPRYFVLKNDLLPLVNMGIEDKILCAAFEMVE